MKVLDLNRKIFVMMWVLPTPVNKSKWIKFRNIFIGSTSLFLIFTGLIASACFVHKYLSINWELSFHTLSQICAWSSQGYMIIVSLILWRKFVAIFPELQEIYDKNKHLDHFNFMEVAHKKTEFVTRVLAKHMVTGWFSYCLLLGVSGVISSILKFGHVDPTRLVVPFKFVLPWDQKTLCGWFAEWIFAMFSGGAYFLINGALLSFFIGICLYHQAYGKIIRALLDRLDNSDCDSDRNGQLIEIIRFHNAAKGIFQQSADVYSICILILLICSMMLMALSVFKLDLAFRNVGPAIVLVMISTCVSASNLFLYCYYGQSAHETYLSLSNHFFGANWPSLSPKLQKYFVPMIASAQRPLYYDGFGVAYLDLNTFLRMIRTVISYYMSFKALTASM